MRKACVVCGEEFEARVWNAKVCGGVCRKRKQVLKTRAWEKCNPSYKVDYRLRNKDRIRDSRRAYHLSHADRLCQKQRSYYAENRQKINERIRLQRADLHAAERTLREIETKLETMLS